MTGAGGGTTTVAFGGTTTTATAAFGVETDAEAVSVTGDRISYLTISLLPLGEFGSEQRSGVCTLAILIEAISPHLRFRLGESRLAAAVDLLLRLELLLLLLLLDEDDDDDDDDDDNDDGDDDGEDTDTVLA